MTGQTLSFQRHARLELGVYVQTHEEHDNSMGPRTLGAICLGPTGNQQGGHWFLSLPVVRGLSAIDGHLFQLPEKSSTD